MRVIDLQGFASKNAKELKINDVLKIGDKIIVDDKIILQDNDEKKYEINKSAFVFDECISDEVFNVCDNFFNVDDEFLSKIITRDNLDDNVVDFLENDNNDVYFIQDDDEMPLKTQEISYQLNEMSNISQNNANKNTEEILENTTQVVIGSSDRDENVISDENIKNNESIINNLKYEKDEKPKIIQNHQGNLQQEEANQIKIPIDNENTKEDKVIKENEQTNKVFYSITKIINAKNYQEGFALDIHFKDFANRDDFIFNELSNN